MSRFEFEAIGSSWQIDVLQNLSREREVLLLNEIMERISVFDKAYSRFRNDSLVTEMSRTAGEYILPDDSGPMMSHYKKMYDVTGGMVTPLIGQVLVDAGYDAKYSLVENELTKPLSWEEVMEWNFPRLNMKVPSLLDFGAGGKGYLVDIISEILEKNDIFSYCVDGSGDMRQRSESGEVFAFGLEHPDDLTQVIGVVKLLNGSICGSAGNRRKWGNFHHIINPESLSSPREISAVWAVAGSTLLADLLTTALFFTPPEILAQHFQFQYLILYSDYSVKKSDGLDVELFT